MPDTTLPAGFFSNLTGRNCPNIPSDKRLLNDGKRMGFRSKHGISLAKPNLQNASQQERQDATILARWVNAQQHRASALADLAEDPTQTSDGMFERLFELAKIGHSKRMIGTANARRISPPRPGTIPDDAALLAMGCDSVPRESDWIGISPVWEDFKDTQVVVIESNIVPGEPGLIIGMPPDDVGSSFQGMTDGRDFPDGNPETVRDILLWHGAQAAHWCRINGRDPEAMNQLEERGYTGTGTLTWHRHREEEDTTAWTIPSTGWSMPELTHFWQIQSAEEAMTISEYAITMAEAAMGMSEEALRDGNEAAAQGATLAAKTMAERAVRSASVGMQIGELDSRVPPKVREQTRQVFSEANSLHSVIQRQHVSKKRGSHSWYAEACHRLLRHSQFIPLTQRFMDEEAATTRTTDEVLFGKALMLQQFSTWPSADIYDVGKMEVGSEPDPELGAVVRRKDQEVRDAIAPVLATCNERLTTRTSPFIRIFPELERKLRNTLFPLAGCMTGFEYASARPDSDMARAMIKGNTVTDQLEPVEFPAGPYTGSVGWTCFVWMQERIAKAVPEAYPKGFPPQIAYEHASQIRATFEDLIADEEAGTYDTWKQPFAQMLFSLEHAIENNIHTLNGDDIAALDDAAIAEGLDVQARHTMFREITLYNNLFTYLTYNSPRESIALRGSKPRREKKTLSQKTADKLAAAARDVGVPSVMANRMVLRMMQPG